MEQNINEKIDQMNAKIDKMYSTVERLRKYFLWTGIITIILFVLPLIGLVFAIPQFMNNYAAMLN